MATVSNAMRPAMLGIETGNQLEFDHIGDGTLQLRKVGT